VTSMFERYTERARRVIFFTRYEASHFGSTIIETEHFLLGLIREDWNLTHRFLRNHSSIESIRKEIEGRTTIREKVSTAIDLPMSNECKRILAYAAEEAERLNHRHIGAEDMLLGILREESAWRRNSSTSWPSLERDPRGTGSLFDAARAAHCAP
jgi:ATP-dependent Clp protease ATP-binding subunit ClpC